jgi:hypothetical protein
MEFTIDDGGWPLDGVLRYIGSEHSFRFDIGEPQVLLDRSGDSGATSLSVGTLQIEVGVASGVVLYVWGLHPRFRWQQQPVGSPHPRTGTVRISNPSALQGGVSLEIAALGAWPTTYDRDSGWVQVGGEAGDSEGDDQVLIASGIVLGLHLGCLRSIWLQPVFD